MTIKLLTYTTLYPNAAQPSHGVFVENRLRHLLDYSDIESKVLAPVPWFPLKSKKFGKYSAFANSPRHEIRYQISIKHPRFPVVPKIGMTISPVLLAAASLPAIKKLIREGYDFDIIDAHYFYPDGVSACIVGKLLNKPVVITARGSDITLIPRYSLPRKMIIWASRQAEALITVCNALKDEMVCLGVEEEKITPLRNGVDLEMFDPPSDRVSLRRSLNIFGKTLLSVGNLIKLKGHDLVIKTLPDLPEAVLLIAGTGPEKKYLQLLAQKLNVADRVVFLGLVPHNKLKDYYGAADITVLASEREGWANVLLESMACGTPVVATNIWGTPEVVAAPEAGILARQRTAQAITSAIKILYGNYPDRTMTRKYAEQFNWDATSSGQLEIFTKIMNRC